jgi:ketosteroid isomerase-like protein
MSRRNVEIVRAAYSAWNAGDMEALGALYAVDAVTRGLDDWPEAGPNVGRDAIVTQYRRMIDAWDENSVQMVGPPVEAGDRVAVRTSLRGAGRGPEFKVELSGVYTLRNGLIQSVDFFWDHAEALEAAGFSEPSA